MFNYCKCGLRMNGKFMSANIFRFIYHWIIVSASMMFNIFYISLDFLITLFSFVLPLFPHKNNVVFIQYVNNLLAFSLNERDHIYWIYEHQVSATLCNEHNNIFSIIIITKCVIIYQHHCLLLSFECLVYIRGCKSNSYFNNCIIQNLLIIIWKLFT